MAERDTREGATARRWAWSLCAMTVAVSAGQIALLVAGGLPLVAAESLDEPFPTVTIAVAIGSVIGAAIVDRHPRHRVGWLICAGQAGAALGLAAQALALAVLVGDLPVPAPVGHLAGWLGSMFGASYALTLLGLVLLLVPDGHLPSRRWTPMAVLLVGGFCVATSGLFLVPPGSFGATDASEAPAAAIALAEGGQIAVTVGLAGSAVALVRRLRGARGELRQQLRWMGAAAAAVAAAVAAVVFDGVTRGADAPQRWYLQQLLYLSYLAFQVATGFAVLRYRLYDIDVIIGRTLRLAALGLFATAGYVSAVVALGSLLAGSTSGLWPSLAAYVLVALAFQPLRRQVDRLADRVVYGPRAAPYDNLAELSRQLAAGGLSDRELLELAARCGALAVGASSARATVFLPAGAEVSAGWPPDGEYPTDAAVPVTDRGEVLGRIELGLRPGHALTRAQRRLLDELATQLTLAFRNMRLMAALHRRAEEVTSHRAELEASRRRLLTAADTERRRVAAAIRAEVAVHLDPLPPALTDVERRLARDPTGAPPRLHQLQESVTRAIEALRSITAGVLPPLLARRGLAAAVRAHVSRTAHRAAVAIGADLPERLDPSVEAAAYQFVVQALATVGPGSQVSIAPEDGRLRLSVRGRGADRTPDRQPVLDRVQAVGGQLDEVDGGEGFVEFRAVLPLDPSAQAAVSRSGPKTDFLM
jgi:signal transduction histidine kinase